MILLDTNVVSELMRAKPNQNVQKWLEKQAIESLFLSSITLAEIYFGLEILPDGRKKQALFDSFNGEILPLFDKRILSFQNRGKLCPKRELIKTKEQIEGIRRAGVLNTAVLDMVAENIKEGMSTEALNQLVHNFTIEHGGVPAPLNYEGFPKSVCTSINEVVCHGIPKEEDVLELLTAAPSYGIKPEQLEIRNHAFQNENTIDYEALIEEIYSRAMQEISGKDATISRQEAEISRLRSMLPDSLERADSLSE